MPRITMVDVRLEDYSVKVKKTIEMISGKTWIFDNSGTLINNLCNQLDRWKHEETRVWDGNKNFEHYKNENEYREFVDDIIREIKDLNESGESINLLIINAGKLFSLFSMTSWNEKRSRDGLKDEDKTITDRINDLVTIIRNSDAIKKCIVFNRVVDSLPGIQPRYPGCFEALETNGVVERTTVTELVTCPEGRGFLPQNGEK